MMKTQRKPISSSQPKSLDYKLSITLSQELVDAIDREADGQYRTRASLIRQTLAEKFQEVT